MASSILYPPTINSYLPAFLTKQNCRVYFSLSRMSAQSTKIKSIHVSVTNQQTGVSVVNKKNDASQRRWRSTGIIVQDIIGDIPYDNEKQMNYIDLIPDDIENGWTSGWIYKIQVRVGLEAFSSNPDFYGKDTFLLADWLVKKMNTFSEWSTICIVKSISKPTIKIPLFEFNSDNYTESSNIQEKRTFGFSSLEINGSYSSQDLTENLYSYELTLYDSTGNQLETSGLIYPDEYNSFNKINYLFKTELDNSFDGKVILKYITNNFYSESYSFYFDVSKSLSESIDIYLKRTKDELIYEQEEGCLILQLYSPDRLKSFSGNLCIRRCSSKDNFTRWEDLKVLGFKDALINNTEPFYDFSVESGTYYKYGVQAYNEKDNIITRGVLNETDPIMVEFNYSFLLGENGQQLKLMLDNTMNNYKYNYQDTKLDTIGSKYPYITRNSNVEYRSFPVSGLISYNTDPEHLFLKENFYYNQTDTPSFGEQNLTYEREFREKVLAFLQNGKIKLYKSPTEGNILIRLMDINTTPVQSLGRLIYSFTSTAYEIGVPTIAELKRLNMIPHSSGFVDFSTYEYKLGQVIADFSPGENIFDKIKEKYQSVVSNQAGYQIDINEIEALSISFDSSMIVNYNNQRVLGNIINYNGQQILITPVNDNCYVFDPDIKFNLNSSINIMGGIENPNAKIHATLDFLYLEHKDMYVEKILKNRKIEKGVGQIYDAIHPGEDIYKKLIYKYYYDWGYETRKLDALICTSIEATPGSVFSIKDAVDKQPQIHIINETGYLNISNITDIIELKYLGKIDQEGNIESKNTDLVLDYLYRTYINIY